MKDNAMGRFATRMGHSGLGSVLLRSKLRSARQRLRTDLRTLNNLSRSAVAPGDTAAIVSREEVRTRARSVPVRFRARVRTGRFSSRLQQGAGQ